MTPKIKLQEISSPVYMMYDQSEKVTHDGRMDRQTDQANNNVSKLEGAGIISQYRTP